MFEFLSLFMDTSGFKPDGPCPLWTPSLISINVIADAMIFVALVSISIALILLITRVIGAVARSPDITARKAREKPSKESQDRLRILSEAVPQMIWTSNSQGRPTFFNQRWLEYTGLSREQSMRSELDKVLHPLDAKASRDAWNQAVATATGYQAELRLRNQKGEYRWHLARSLPVRDEQGVIIQWFGTITDIHDQKIAEEKSRSLERNLMTVLDFAPIILWAADRQGMITLSQGKCLEKLGFKSGELVGRHVTESGGDIEQKLQSHRRALAGESWTAITHDKGLWFETHYSPMRDTEGDIIGQVAVSTDITERRLAEIAEMRHKSGEASAHEASRLKSEFLAHMSHEIRTPLNGLMGMINLISNAPLNSELREYVDHAIISGEALLSVIDNVLDFSKIEAGKLDFEIINFNLYDLIHDTEKSFFYTARTKGLRIYTDIGSDVPRFILGDSGRLRQVLSNLISNAIKFTSQGSVSLRIWKTIDKNDTEKLHFEVIDTGIGISKAGQDRIFKAFSQADSSTTRRFGGTGLGLSICKHLVERMNGQIDVESQVGKGSKFWFTLTLCKGEEEDYESTARKEIPPLPTNLRAHILVADDNMINRKVILKFLDSMGFRAQAVSNGFDVIKALSEDHFDLIFMDCQMPDMDGYECTKWIRQSAEPYQELPIVALSASALQRDHDRCLEVGMDAYIAKPIKREALHSAIINLLQHRDIL